MTDMDVVLQPPAGLPMGSTISLTIGCKGRQMMHSGLVVESSKGDDGDFHA